jgi:mono/diheme cytochrome c family protein
VLIEHITMRVVATGTANTRSPAGVLALAGALFLGAIGQASAAAQAGGARTTVLDGVYTIAQARRGQAAYDESCSDCHQRDLSGGDRGSALAGDEFVKAWISLTVGDLFDRIRTSMPSDRPGSLTPDTTSDIVAFMLQANDYPAGGAELRPDPAVLKGITITSKN